MALLAVLVLGWLGWAIATGRVRRPDTARIGGLILALAGGAIAARGSFWAGAAMAAGGLLWLSRKPRVTAMQPAAPDDVRTRDAYDLLGLPMDADRSAILDAHRRLIARNHPDAGGTEALARNINAARDYLLNRLR